MSKIVMELDIKENNDQKFIFINLDSVIFFGKIILNNCQVNSKLYGVLCEV